MKKYLVVATEQELVLPYAKINNDREVIVTGVGGTNVIQALKDLPKNSLIVNVGYCGSKCFKVGDYVFIHECRLYHPNVEFNEPTFQITDCGHVLCLTAGDFVQDGDLPDNTVVDMELAYIAALGFKRITSIKYISDNLNLKQYSRTSSLTDSSPAPDPAGERRTQRKTDDAGRV